MPDRPCPSCGRQPPSPRTATSVEADVSYYRCDGCGAVWKVPELPPQIIVPGKPSTPEGG